LVEALQKVAGSIPDGVIEIFHLNNPSSLQNRNEYQEYFLSVKGAGA
jgi:hypothetical protein